MEVRRTGLFVPSFHGLEFTQERRQEMAVQLGKDVVELLQDSETIKVLATIDENGFPHVVAKQSLELGEDGNLVHLEFLESSRSGKNLLRSIWFDRKVAVTLLGRRNQSFQIKGKPVRSIITGPVFQRHYLKVRETLGDVGLAAVWVIEPEEVIDESFSARLKEEEATHPSYKHLDLFAVSSKTPG